jgi:hypothetical protein
MATIGECTAALASQISSATGLRTTAYVPEDLDPPALFVAFDRLRIRTMSAGSVDLFLDCVVFTSRASDRVGQKLLLEYLSLQAPKSVVAAIMADPTLGLSGVSCSPASDDIRSLGVDEIAAYGYYGGVVPVLITTSGA